MTGGRTAAMNAVTTTPSPEPLDPGHHVFLGSEGLHDHSVRGLTGEDDRFGAELRPAVREW